MKCIVILKAIITTQLVQRCIVIPLVFLKKTEIDICMLRTGINKKTNGELRLDVSTNHTICSK